MNKDQTTPLEHTAEKNREKQMRSNAIKVSRAVGIAMAFIILFFEVLLMETSTVGLACLAVVTAMTATEHWVVAIAMKKKNEVVNAVIDTCFFIASTAFFITGIL